MQKARKTVLPTVLVLIALTVLLLVQPVAAENGGTFHVGKQTDPPGLDEDFEFTFTPLSAPSVVGGEITFSLFLGEEEKIEQLPFGAVFRVAETVPDGWNVRIDCSDTGPDDVDGTDFDWIQESGKGWVVIEVPELDDFGEWDGGCLWTNTPPVAAPPPFVREASTLLLLGGAATSLAGYVGLQNRARRRK